MVVEEYLAQSRAWLMNRPRDGVVISSRVRLARNLEGAAFPGWCGKQERVRLHDRLRDVLCQLPELSAPVSLAMANLTPIDREMLKERYLISSELAAKDAGSGVVISEPEHVAVMINEEDHLRMQAMRPGLDLSSAWQCLRAIDEALEAHLTFAFSPRLGFLTACPSNVGTGLRASVMVHLPGLRLMNEVEQVIKGLTRMGLAVRGALGEGTDAYGNMYQVSNQTTLGRDEESMIAALEDTIAYLVKQEEQARARLLEQRPIQVLDHCARAVGILNYACILSSGEAMDILSGLRFGVELGTIKGVSVARLNEMMLLSQPGHLQKQAHTELEPDARDQLRAELIRKTLKGVTLVRQEL
jgi:protein arginine kinase